MFCSLGFWQVFIHHGTITTFLPPAPPWPLATVICLSFQYFRISRRHQTRIRLVRALADRAVILHPTTIAKPGKSANCC